MTDKNKNDDQPKGFGIVHQYVKDFSFENLLTAEDMLNLELQPKGDISLSVNAAQVQDTIHEVVIKVKIEAKDENADKEVYIAEIEYGALVQVEGFDETETSGILLVEAPRLIFPYVRSNIAEMTREGGFASLAMAPVDFLNLFLESSKTKVDAEGNA